jgi:hypothetical protein
MCDDGHVNDDDDDGYDHCYGSFKLLVVIVFDVFVGIIYLSLSLIGFDGFDECSPTIIAQKLFLEQLKLTDTTPTDIATDIRTYMSLLHGDDDLVVPPSSSAEFIVGRYCSIDIMIIILFITYCMIEMNHHHLQYTHHHYHHNNNYHRHQNHRHSHHHYHHHYHHHHHHHSFNYSPSTVKHSRTLFICTTQSYR